MINVIAIFLIIKAVSNGIKMPQKGYKPTKEFIGHILIEFILLVIHLWFGVWMLLNL